MNAVRDTPPAQLELTFAADADGCSRVTRRRVRYPYTFLKPFWFGDRPRGIATAMLQSGSGGLFGGEQLSQMITVEQGAAAHVTTQSAAIVHAARGTSATVQGVHLRAGRDAFLEYLPEPMILFRGARLAQRVTAELGSGAVLLFADGIVRHDPGPRDAPFDTWQNELEVFAPDGRLLFADRMAVTGAEFDAVLQCGDQPWRASGMLAIAAPDACDTHATLIESINGALEKLNRATGAGLYAAAAALPNRAGVLCRIAAQKGEGLRAALESCWHSARVGLTGAPPPRRRK